MLRECSPQDHRTWRPSVLLTLLADHGFRINAALHLRWDDVDLEAGTIRLRPEWDKRKRGWTRPMTVAAYSAMLLKIEEKAGIPHRKYRAFHGLRRMAVGNVRQQTGDVTLGLLWVGDHDVRQAAAYSKERPDEIGAVAAGIVPESYQRRKGDR
jgi:integrase